MDEDELTLEENQFVYGMVDAAAKSLGIQNKEAFEKCVTVGEKLAAKIKKQAEEQQKG